MGTRHGRSECPHRDLSEPQHGDAPFCGCDDAEFIAVCCQCGMHFHASSHERLDRLIGAARRRARELARHNSGQLMLEVRA